MYEDTIVIEVLRSVINRLGTIYFKSGDLARQATKILGEATIRLAFSTDW